jgi:hypothetical protein
MNFILFSDMKYGDEDSMRDFLFHNSLSHKAVAEKFIAGGMTALTYPLDDIGDLQDWLTTHAMVHQRELSNLGATEVFHILDDTDWSDEHTFRNWHFMHALLHQQVDQALGIV